MSNISTERVSSLHISEKLLISKTFLTEKERIDILNFINEDQKNKLKEIGDNLILTERTDWEYHKNEKFKEYYEKIILKELKSGMRSITNQYADPNIGGMDADTYFDIKMINMWFAKFKDGGYTRPHNHFCSFGSYAFSCYLKLPSSRSSITFCNSLKSQILNVEVREGDILIFPGHLQHWSFDVEENRSLLSGNFTLLVNSSYSDNE